MQPFKTSSGIAAPLLEDDINTDQITPVSQAPTLSEDYGALFFRNRRFTPAGEPTGAFVTDQPPYIGARILVTGHNFGCGSSREMAVWAMQAVGINVIVARSFADYYRENCLQNGILPIALGSDDAQRFEQLVLVTAGLAPFHVDLDSQTIIGPAGATFHFEIPAADRIRLLEGLDDIGLSEKFNDEIVAYERGAAATRPWSQQARPGDRT